MEIVAEVTGRTFERGNFSAMRTSFSERFRLHFLSPARAALDGLFRLPSSPATCLLSRHRYDELHHLASPV